LEAAEPAVEASPKSLGERLIMLMFGIKLNDTTNAFKAYRATVIQGVFRCYRRISM